MKMGDLDITVRRLGDNEPRERDETQLQLSMMTPDTGIARAVTSGELEALAAYLLRVSVTQYVNDATEDEVQALVTHVIREMAKMQAHAAQAGAKPQ